MRASRWQSWVAGGALLLWGDLAVAQTSNVETAPAREIPPPPSETPAAPGAWWTPPPLAQGSTWRAAGANPSATPSPSGADATDAPRSAEEFVSSERRSEDPQFAGRVVAEAMAAGVAVVGTGMLVYFMIQSTDNAGMALLTLFTGVTAYALLPPLAVHGVGRAFGGNGKVWASLLAGFFIPVIGHVVGYELSHTALCEPGARTAHPRRAPTLASSLEDRAPRWAPAVAPTGQGGAVVALTLAF
jgi:hypothetical protein